MKIRHWQIFFIKAADGDDQIPLILSEERFCEVFHAHRPSIDGKRVFQRITRLLSESPRRRAGYPVMRKFYRGYRKCKAGRKIRIFFKVDEESLILIFGAHHRSRLEEMGKHYH